MVDQVRLIDMDVNDEEAANPTEVDSGAPADAERRRQRSTIGFPYTDLESALGVARAIHEKGGGQCDLDQLAAWMGHETVSSGAFNLKIAAARLFGLIEGDRQRIRLTSLGKDAIDPQKERSAKAEAFLNVPLYRRIYDEHRGGLLPPDIGLQREMQQFGVTAKQADKARQTFQRSASQAGFFATGKSRLVMPGGASSNEPARSPSQRPPGHPGIEARHNPDQLGASGGSGNAGGPPIAGTDHGSDLHPAIAGLLQTLPPSGSEWPQDQRAVWLNAAEMLFKLVYKDSAPS
jgi:hypothetical protein